MLKIVHLITSLEVGGAEMMLYKLVSNLDRERFTSHVVSMTTDMELAPRFEKSGIKVQSLGMRRGWPNPTAIGRLNEILRQQRPALIQTWLYHADLMGLLSGRWCGVPVVWNLRCAEGPALGSLRTRLIVQLLGWLSRKPAMVIVNSRTGKSAHESLGYAPRRWRVIRNGIDIANFRPDAQARAAIRRQIGIGQETPLIGMVARLDPLKDHTTFFKAAEILLSRQPDVHFALAGKAMEPSHPSLLKIIPASLHGDRRIHLMGPRNDVPEVMSALDVFTLSSVSEGFPNTVAEAMACGVPCVATDAGDMAEIVGPTGTIVPPRNPMALAHGWAGMLDSLPSRSRELGLAARQRVIDRFSLDRVVADYAALYEELATAPV